MLVPVTLLLGMIELAFRFVPQPPADAVLDRFVVPDPDLLWRLRPAARGPLATNELGLRDTPYRAQADVKILVLGDSVTWGDGIDEITRTFSYLLERRLSARHPGRTFEVVNAGVPGYTTEQEATYLERDGLALGPDAIIAQFTLNDVITRPPWLTRWPGREALREAYGLLVRHSRAFAAIARAMQQRARAQETSQVQELVQPVWSREVERAWQRMLAQLDRIRSLAGERGIPLLLLATPYRAQLDDPGGQRHPQERLAEYATAHGLPYVDVLPQLAALPRAAANQCFHDADHFSHLGHDLVADMLLEPVDAALGLGGRQGASDGDAAGRREDKVRAYALADEARAASAAHALPKARALLAEAERLAPDVGLVYQFEANVAYLAGDREGAIRALEHGLALEPDNPLFRTNLAATARESTPSR
jgi:lysophospholipase L1-like esterase